MRQSLKREATGLTPWYVTKASSSLDKTKKWDTKKAKKSTEGIAKKHKFEKGKEWDMDDSEVSDIAKLEKKRKK